MNTDCETKNKWTKNLSNLFTPNVYHGLRRSRCRHGNATVAILCVRAHSNYFKQNTTKQTITFVGKITQCEIQLYIFEKRNVDGVPLWQKLDNSCSFIYYSLSLLFIELNSKTRDFDLIMWIATLLYTYTQTVVQTRINSKRVGWDSKSKFHVFFHGKAFDRNAILAKWRCILQCYVQCATIFFFE